jgi:DNA-binding response OmpR family regulator
MRVLVVEDDRKVAAFIRRGLEEEGCRVDVLHGGVEAGDQGRLIDYDAAGLDLMLPGCSGLQVLRDLRAHKGDLGQAVCDRRGHGPPPRADAARTAAGGPASGCGSRNGPGAPRRDSRRAPSRSAAEGIRAPRMPDVLQRPVEVHINCLRNKVDRGFDVPLIHTVRGVGYVLSDRGHDFYGNLPGRETEE